jgi:hypothetical protein
MNQDLQHALVNLIRAHRILLDGREAHIEFWEQAVSQTCKRIAEAMNETTKGLTYLPIILCG